MLVTEHLNGIENWTRNEIRTNDSKNSCLLDDDTGPAHPDTKVPF